MPDTGMSAEDFAKIIGAVALLITAIGGMAIWRGRSEVKEQDGPSAAAQLKSAVDANTEAVRKQTDQFVENNRLFQSVLKEAEQIRTGITDLRLDLRGK